MHLRMFINFLRKQLTLEGQWEVEISEISYPSMYQNVTEQKIMFFDRKSFKLVRMILSGHRSLPFDYRFVEAMKTLIQERHDHTKSSLAVKVSRRTQKIEIPFANEGSVFAFFYEHGSKF